MTYIVTTVSRKEKEVNLFLMDRSKTKAFWWNDRLSNDILYIRNIEKARSIIKKLKHNNPRIITLEEAKTLETQNKIVRNFMSKQNKNLF